MSNPSPPEARQMLARQSSATQVIRQQANGVWICDPGKRIEQRHANPPKVERWSQIRPAPGDDDAVDITGNSRAAARAPGRRQRSPRLKFTTEQF
jgi:hypothetical protein